MAKSRRGGRGQKSGSLGDKHHRHDAAYLRAKQENYAARAIYKLEEIDKRFKIVKSGANVLDLGCWPGSWMQYLADRVGEAGHVIGVDLAEVEIGLPEHATTFVGDVFKLRPAALTKRFGEFDLVVSDLAPKTTGDSESDAHRSEELFLRALELATQSARPGAHFVAKVFQGGRFPNLIKAVRSHYQQAKAFRPKSTRVGSREQYIVGRGLRRPGAVS